MSSKERLDALTQFLERNTLGSLAELAQVLGVSENTVRRDLDKLEQQGRVRRTRGGALYTKPADFEPAWAIRWSEHIQEKKRIAVAAARLIHQDETILLDSGSTTLYLAKQLSRAQRITVVTTSLPVMWELGDNPDINLVALGGEYYHRERYFRGPSCERELEQLRVDKVFLGISSIEAGHGLSEAHYTEVPLKQAMMKISREHIVLGDGSKVGRAAPFRLCAASDVDLLITDASAAPAAIEELRNAGLTVLVADEP